MNGIITLNGVEKASVSNLEFEDLGVPNTKIKGVINSPHPFKSSSDLLRKKGFNITSIQLVFSSVVFVNIQIKNEVWYFESIGSFNTQSESNPRATLKDIQNNVQNSENAFRLNSEQKDPRRLTNIDWSKDTPKTAEAWKALSPEERLDWSIWHEIKLQHMFATIAILLEIISAIVAIVCMECGVGLSILICLATLTLAIVTGVFSSFLYRALRACVAGGLIGSVVAFIVLAATSEGTLRTLLIILGYIGSIALMGSMEAKGAIGKKIPDFPGPKEPGLIDDMKKLRQEWKKAAANRPKRTKKPKRSRPSESFGQYMDRQVKSAEKMKDTFGW